MTWRRIPTPSDEALRELRAAYRGKARLLVDENAGPEVADFLRGGGFNVKFVGEAGICGHPDEDVFALAWREKRVLVTHDEDFLNDRRFPPHRNSGIIRIGPALMDAIRRVFEMPVCGNCPRRRDRKPVYRQKDRLTSPDTFTIYEPGGTKTRFSWPDKGPIMQWEE